MKENIGEKRRTKKREKLKNKIKDIYTKTFSKIQTENIRKEKMIRKENIKKKKQE